MKNLIDLVEAEHLKSGIPDFKAGYTLNVHYRIIEGDKERVQQFQGVCINRRGEGMGATFIVRKISGGIGTERIFPLHSPNIEQIEIVKKGSVRRAKLFYLRGRSGKASRLKEQK